MARGNFATLKDGLVIDRRAGRIPTSQNEVLCQKLNNALTKQDKIKISLSPGKEHRFVAKFSGEGLSDDLSDADPQKDHKPIVFPRALSEEATATAGMVKAFMNEVTAILSDSAPANTVLLRGFSKSPSIPTMTELYKIAPAAVAQYPMYKGLARLIGMMILHPGESLEELFETVEANYDNYNFFYVHFKKTDAAGEDGNFEGKKQAIEEVDQYLPRLAALKPEVLVVTSDHSTPCALKSHSWHPNPFLLKSQTSQPDKVIQFSERECSQGYLGRFQAIYAMPLILAHAGKLKKFGA